MRFYEKVSVTLWEYDKDKHEYKATLGNKDIIVDPYVGEVWGNNDVRIGSFDFYGHWHEDCFIVVEEVNQ